MLNEYTIVSTFFVVDEFLKTFFEKFPKFQVPPKRGFLCGLNISENITICLLFQFSQSRHFKAFYQYADIHLKPYFPDLVSYSRFISLKKNTSFFLYVFLMSLFGKCNGISFIDSTPLAVCKIKEFQGIEFLNLSQREEKPVWDGFLDLSCISSLILREKF